MIKINREREREREKETEVLVYFGKTLIVYAEGKHNDNRFVFEGMRFTGGVVVSWWICVQLVATLVSGVVSRPEAPIIKLYDPTLETSSSPDVIEYTSEVGGVSFLEQYAGAEPDPQKMSPHRLECECSFKKSNPQGRPNSAYHIAKLPASQLDPLSDRKLQDVVRSHATSGSKIPEMRNLKAGEP